MERVTQTQEFEFVFKRQNEFNPTTLGWKAITPYGSFGNYVVVVDITDKADPLKENPIIEEVKKVLREQVKEDLFVYMNVAKADKKIILDELLRRVSGKHFKVWMEEDKIFGRYCVRGFEGERIWLRKGLYYWYVRLNRWFVNLLFKLVFRLV